MTEIDSCIFHRNILVSYKYHTGSLKRNDQKNGLKLLCGHGRFSVCKSLLLLKFTNVTNTNPFYANASILVFTVRAMLARY